MQYSRDTCINCADNSTSPFLNYEGSRLQLMILLYWEICRSHVDVPTWRYFWNISQILIEYSGETCIESADNSTSPFSNYEPSIVPNSICIGRHVEVVPTFRHGDISANYFKF